MTKGSLWSWGYNLSGQLGLGDSGFDTNRTTPTQVGTKKWTHVATGDSHTMAIDTEGYLWGWGYNGSSELGLGDYDRRTTPTQVGTKKWSQVSAGSSHTMAIDTDGILWGWGANSTGQLGLGDSGSSTNRTTPTQVGTKRWKQVATYSSHTMAIDTDGHLWGWGANSWGQLGLGDTTPRYEPTQVGTKKWSQVSTGELYTMAIDTEGYLWGWGYNYKGQLGLGDTTDRYEPTQVGTKKWSQVSAGDDYTMAIDTDGYLWGWGNNYYGQLGLGDSGSSTNRTTPTQVGTKKWTHVATGDSHTMAIDTDGHLWGWGDNDHGQLGLGDSGSDTYRTTPTKVGTKKWTHVLAGYDYTMAILNEGSISPTRLLKPYRIELGHTSVITR